MNFIFSCCNILPLENEIHMFAPPCNIPYLVNSQTQLYQLYSTRGLFLLLFFVVRDGSSKKRGRGGKEVESTFPPTPQSLLVCFSNLHNFTVTLRALSEGKSTTVRCLCQL